VRFVAFTNEEEPFFQTDAMGSAQYVQNAKARGDDIKAMLSLETIGYYSDAAGSQDVPRLAKWLLGVPDVGNFIAFVSSWRSRSLTQRTVSTFQAVSPLRCEGLMAHPYLVEQVHWSDNWAFDEAGIPALMITDTAPARNRCYHRDCDTPERLDYGRMARATLGVARVTEALATVDDLSQ
jgi:Zn-dependent M28 family amino/carboxypeptidase